MVYRKKKGTVAYGCLLVLLFLAMMNFQSKYFYLFFLSTAVVIAIYKVRYINLTFLLYVSMGVLMAIYNIEYGMKAMIRCLVYPAAYYIGFALVATIDSGYVSVCEKYAILQKRIYQVLVICCTGAFTHYIMNFILSFSGDVWRNTKDIWTGETMSATGQASLACLMVGLSSALILSAKKKIYFYLGVLITIAALTYNMVLAGRTLFVMYFFFLSLGFTFYMYQTKQYNKLFKVLICFLLFILLFATLWSNNFVGVRDWIEGTNFYMRFWGKGAEGLVNDTRIENRIGFLKNMIDYPFGGLHLNEKYGYAHDLLLDGYDRYGLIGFVFLVMVLFDGIKQLICFSCNKNTEISVKMSCFCVYLCIFLEFCMEPILAGMPWLFACFCMLNGMIVNCNRKLSVS